MQLNIVLVGFFSLLHATVDYILVIHEFLRIVDISIENFTTHLHLYKQPTSRSVKALKRKMEKLHSKYVFAPADNISYKVCF